jgi:hypothetical protein
MLSYDVCIFHDQPVHSLFIAYERDYDFVPVVLVPRALNRSLQANLPSTLLGMIWYYGQRRMCPSQS